MWGSRFYLLLIGLEMTVSLSLEGRACLYQCHSVGNPVST
jgi:hypothetical protein